MSEIQIFNNAMGINNYDYVNATIILHCMIEHWTNAMKTFLLFL